jgi:hypothetical protein
MAYFYKLYPYRSAERCFLYALRTSVSAPTMRLLLLAVLPAVRAGEYDSCGRPDAVFAAWDQVNSLRHAQPRSLHCRDRHRHHTPC